MYQILCTGAVVAQWTRPRTFNREVPGSNLLVAAAVVPLGKALYPHCLVPRKGLKAVGPWLLAYKQLALCVCDGIRCLALFEYKLLE